MNKVLITVQHCVAYEVMFLPLIDYLVAWSGGVLAIKKSQVRLPCNDSWQVVHTHVPMLSSSIVWYWQKGGDAMQLKSEPRTGQKVTAGSYRRV